MSLLEDAIRDHLELLRRRGADPAEVARAEREVLGPPEEPELTAEAAGVIPATPVTEEPAAAEPPTEVVAAEPGPVAVEPEPEPEPEPVDPEPLAADPEQGTVAFSSEDLAEAMQATPVEPEPAAAEPAPEVLVVEERVEVVETEVIVVEAPAPEHEEHLPTHEEPLPEPAAHEHDAGEPGEPDVLDETPDFLQETPEHDRLWFEQAPPRDFDF